MPKQEALAKPQKRMSRRVIVLAAFIVVVVGGSIAAFTYLSASSKTIYIDKAQIAAPAVDLGPSAPGILQAVYVAEGDIVAPNTVVAEVGTELIKTTQGGLVTVVNNNIGKTVSPGNTVVETIDPLALRVTGQIAEDKGLVDIKPGQRAVFEIDAFGSKQYEGIVDEVAPEAVSSDVVFTISDKRQEQNFEVKVRFDTVKYPELKNGMSAKIWVYKN